MTRRDIDPWFALLVGTDGKTYARWRLKPNCMYEPFTLEYKTPRAFSIDSLVLLDADEKPIFKMDLKAPEVNQGCTYGGGLPLRVGDTYQLRINSLIITHR